MHFIVTAYDGENMLEKRMAVRPQHLEGIKELGSHVVCAGGMIDDEGRPKGSVLVMDFEDRAALDDYISNEPYVREGVWANISVESMNLVILSGEKVGK